MALLFYLHCFRCSCGLSLTFHCGGGNGSVQLDPDNPNETWSPMKHTVLSATDAYGTIEFQGGPHPTKAQVNYNCLIIHRMIFMKTQETFFVVCKIIT